MNPAEFADLTDRAEEYLKAKQETLKSRFGLTWYEQYYWDQETPKLVLSSGGVVKLRASIQLVGSISVKSQTWLWSWGNVSVNDQAKIDILEVKRFGLAEAIPPLTKATWEADEADGWRMTAVAAYVLRAEGAYRTLLSGVYTYMVLTHLE